MTMANEVSISAGAWAKGIGYSILASIVGGASKLSIRKSWLMVQDSDSESHDNQTDQSVADGDDALPSSPYHIATNGEIELDTRVNTSNSSESIHQSHSNRQDGEQCLDEGGDPTMASTSEISTVSKRNIASRCLRYSGMFGMTFVNPFFCVLAMNYASPSILAPFSGLTLVWIILFSEQFISERPQAKHVMAACLIVIGQIIVGVFGDHTNDDGITLDDVVASYRQLSFQLFFVAQLLWLSYLAYLIIYPSTPTLKRFAWGVASGSITGFQNFLKDSLSVVKACKLNNDPLPWYFFILAFLAALTAFSGLLILTRCMKRYDATFSSAMFVGSFIISASIMADIHYHTFSHLAGLINYIMYPSGLVILIIGLYILVQNASEPEPNSFEFDSDQVHAQLHNSSSVPGMTLPLVSSIDGEGAHLNTLT